MICAWLILFLRTPWAEAGRSSRYNPKGCPELGFRACERHIEEQLVGNYV